MIAAKRNIGALGQEAGARARLLCATERLLVRSGARSLSLRMIAAESGANSALIAYYFGNIEGLLREIAHRNLDVMIAERTQLVAAAGKMKRRDAQVMQLLDAYLRPMWQAGVFSGEARAALVIEEIQTCAGSELHAEIVARVNDSVAEVADPLLTHLPKLDHARLMLRLRLLCGAAMFATGRAHMYGMFDLTERLPQGQAPEVVFDEMMRFARGAMEA